MTLHQHNLWWVGMPRSINFFPATEVSPSEIAAVPDAALSDDASSEASTPDEVEAFGEMLKLHDPDHAKEFADQADEIRTDQAKDEAERLGDADPSPKADDKSADPDTKPGESDQDTKPADDGKEAATPKTLTISDDAMRYAKALDLVEDGKDPDDVKLFDAALRAYERDAILDDDEIEAKFNKDPGKFVENGLKRAQVQADTDSAFEQLRSPGQIQPNAGADQAGAAGGQADQAQGDQSQPPQPVQISEAVQAVLADKLQTLSDHAVYDELAEPLGEMLTDVAQAIANDAAMQYGNALAQSNQIITEFQNELAEMKMAQVRSEISQASVGLAKEFTDMNTSEGMDKVLDRYDLLVDSENHGYDGPTGVADALTDAAKLVFGDQSKTQLRDKLLSSLKHRRDGQPRGSSNNAPPGDAAPQNPDALEFNEFAKMARQHFGKDADKRM